MSAYAGYYCCVCLCWIPIFRPGMLSIVACAQCGTLHTTAELVLQKELNDLDQEAESLKNFNKEKRSE